MFQSSERDPIIVHQTFVDGHAFLLLGALEMAPPYARCYRRRAI